MSDPVLQKLVGHPSYTPLMAYVAEQCGVTARHTPLDAQQRIDPLELAGQKALRDFAMRLFEDCGWDVTVTPPRLEPQARQDMAGTGGTLATV